MRRSDSTHISIFIGGFARSYFGSTHSCDLRIGSVSSRSPATGVLTLCANLPPFGSAVWRRPGRQVSERLPTRSRACGSSALERQVSRAATGSSRPLVDARPSEFTDRSCRSDQRLSFRCGRRARRAPRAAGNPHVSALDRVHADGATSVARPSAPCNSRLNSTTTSASGLTFQRATSTECWWWVNTITWPCAE